MRYCPQRNDRGPRRAVLAAELAILLPTLGLFAVIIVDFSRAYYYYLTITNCALNGANYASGALDTNVYAATGHYPTTTNITNYANYDANNLGGNAHVSAGSPGTDSYGTYVDVTVTYQFNTIVDFMGLTPSMNLTRTIRTRVLQQNPDPAGS